MNPGKENAATLSTGFPNILYATVSSFGCKNRLSVNRIEIRVGRREDIEFQRWYTFVKVHASTYSNNQTPYTLLNSEELLKHIRRN